MELTFTLPEINEAAADFIRFVKEQKVVAFNGDMGAGKTTFIKALCKALNVTDNVSSPTFSIINQYHTSDNKKIFHLDLYRLKNEEEAVMAGIEECFYSGHWCFVEWPEKTPSLLPENTLHCYLSTLPDNERKLQIKL